MGGVGGVVEDEQAEAGGLHGALEGGVEMVAVEDEPLGTEGLREGDGLSDISRRTGGGREFVEGDAE